MMRIIALIEKESSGQFLLIKDKNNYKFPSIIDKQENLKEKFEEKYNILIKDFTTYKQGGDYIILKSNILKSSSSNNYFFTMNEMKNLNMKRNNEKVLYDLLLDTNFEIINDSFWLGIILSIESQINNIEMKVLLSDFLLFYSTIFCEETLKYNYGDIRKGYEISEKNIKKMRNKYLKACPVYESKEIKSIASEMGVEFKKNIFDIVLYMKNNKVVDVNFRTWNNNKREMLDIYNSIIMSPRNWIKNSNNQFEEIFDEVRNVIIEKYKENFEKKRIKKRTYSSYSLFHNNLNVDEKIYIIQRIGLIKTVLLLCEIFKENIELKNKEKNRIIFDLYTFLRKAKATVIEMIWNDCKNNNLNKIRELVEFEVNKINNKKFWSINRKCRNNFHYGATYIFADEENKILDRYQEEYLARILNGLEKYLHLNFGIIYNIKLFIARALYEKENGNQ